MQITINNVEYTYENDLSNVTISKYVEFQRILSEREQVKSESSIVTDNSVLEDDEQGNTIIYELVPVGEESDSFKQSKYVKILKLLTTIPDDLIDEYVEEYPHFIEYMLNELILYDESSKTDKIKCYQVDLNDNEGFESFNDIHNGYIFEDDDEWYFIPDFNMMRFQEWADIETFTSFNKDVLYTLIVLIRKFNNEPQYEEIGGKFNKRLVCKNIPKYKRNNKRILSNEDKLLLIGDLLVKDVYWLLTYYMDEIYQIKDSYRYIYGQHNVKSEPSPNYDKFSQMIGWEDTICRLAETPVFNSNDGALHTVRNSYFIEVLEYLNVKRGRDIVEMQDYEVRQNKK